jgi:hypothetical protein
MPCKFWELNLDPLAKSRLSSLSFFETASYYIVQAGLKPTAILGPHFPQYCGYHSQHKGLRWGRAHTCTQVYQSVCACYVNYECGGQRSTVCVILNFCSPYFWRQAFSLNLELDDSTRLSGEGAAGILCSRTVVTHTACSTQLSFVLEMKLGSSCSSVNSRTRPSLQPKMVF